MLKSYYETELQLLLNTRMNSVKDISHFKGLEISLYAFNADYSLISLVIFDNHTAQSITLNIKNTTQTFNAFKKIYFSNEVLQNLELEIKKFKKRISKQE